MNTIARYGARAEYTAPEQVPAFSRRWQRAMSALADDDQRHLVDATAQDSREGRASVAGLLVRFDRAEHHAAVVRMLQNRPRRRAAVLAVEPTRSPIVTNGPNTRPASATSAVGFTLAT